MASKKKKKTVVKKTPAKKAPAKKASNKKVVKKKTIKAKPAKAKTQKVKAKAKPTKAKSVKTKTVKSKAVKTVSKKAPVKKAVKAPAVKAVVKKSVAVAPTVKKASVTVDYSKAITPLGDRLVVRVQGSERVTAGGIIIPDSASTATGYLKAEVLAAGTGSKNKKGLLKPLDVKVGDLVLFNSYAGTKVTFNSEELQIIHESDVMGVVQD
ncbi:GroES family chaperonin [Pseudobdellovibrio exovorus]|uniref:Co-chaperonin GroES n=1 Tax=Pseudobdellovibrio exovorus JSS TaxID=1184267 RepID=M4V6H4_9BACT|nr:co-chaperone GroES [Pseudobdellovibrio exovorus]AGH94808.1 chaperonin [Pseudobdellovibrio exovorus JSS]